MNKDEILAKSRAENKNKDVYEQECELPKISPLNEFFLLQRIKKTLEIRCFARTLLANNRIL